jgi:hypothetical protein
MFKAARKGKNKLVSIVVAAKMVSVKKGGLVKPPQNQRKSYHGTVVGFLGQLQFRT